MLTTEQASDLFYYDQDTGVLIRKKRTSNCVRVGDIAGFKTAAGYIYVWVKGKKLAVHRIIWLIKTGHWPSGEIDHIDGDGTNNRFENLRVVDHQSNLRNQRIRSTNKSGTNGVSWKTEKNRWQAYISDENGRTKHLGCFVNKDDAIAARKLAEINLGYHSNHGLVKKGVRR